AAARWSSRRRGAPSSARSSRRFSDGREKKSPDEADQQGGRKHADAVGAAGLAGGLSGLNDAHRRRRRSAAAADRLVTQFLVDLRQRRVGVFEIRVQLGELRAFGGVIPGQLRLL